MNSRRRIGLVLGVVTLLVASVSPAPGAAASDVSGTVTLEGEGPLADVEVFLFGPNQGALFTCTDNQGDYTFVNVSGGVNLVSAAGGGAAAG